MTTAVRVGAVVRQLLTRTALSHRICTGISRKHLSNLIAELTAPWTAAEESEGVEQGQRISPNPQLGKLR